MFLKIQNTKSVTAIEYAALGCFLKNLLNGSNGLFPVIKKQNHIYKAESINIIISGHKKLYEKASINLK